MLNRIYVFPWDQLSEGATAIAKALDTSKILRKNSRYQARKGDVLVNWGASNFPEWLDQYDPDQRTIRLNEFVAPALNKMVFFERTIGNKYVPEFTTSKVKAKALVKGGTPMVCRTKLKGMDGEGIVIANKPDEVVDAKLYVALQPKSAEYRVHIGRDRDGNTSIIGIQRKFLPNGFEGDKRLRVGDDCYFVWTVKGREVIDEAPAEVKAASIAVFDNFEELDFGGLDVIYDGLTGKAYVLEINSAPEQTERSAKMYADFFQQFRQPKPEPEVVDVLDVPMGAVELPPLVENKIEDRPVVPAFAAWYGEYVQNRGMNGYEDCKLAFEAGWGKHKEFVYERIYGG